MGSDKETHILSLQENFEDFFEQSHTGHLITSREGLILRANSCMGDWLGVSPDSLKTKRFSDLLSIGGKIYYETHLWPLLRLQGFFDEVSLELICSDGQRMKITVNGYERRDHDSKPLFIRLTVLKATDRHTYEQNLRQAKTNAENNLSNEKEVAILREQFIAILGHDLRNPLASVTMGAQLLTQMVKNKGEMSILATIKNSAARMSELITNVLDFARVRLGDGIGLDWQSTNLVPVLEHVVEELQIAFLSRTIETDFRMETNIVCDSSRISQLLSNLLANALTHGAENAPVYVAANVSGNVFKLSVSNSGKPIPAEALDRLFQPFSRESTRPSQQGLGLGLYIAAEIARAHHGTLAAVSTDQMTVFTFTMNIDKTV